jgi:hypothetical protein
MNSVADSRQIMSSADRRITHVFVCFDRPDAFALSRTTFGIATLGASSLKELNWCGLRNITLHREHA